MSGAPMMTARSTMVIVVRSQGRHALKLRRSPKLFRRAAGQRLLRMNRKVLDLGMDHNVRPDLSVARYPARGPLR